MNDLEVIALDACLTGIGAVYGKNVYFFDLNDIYVSPTFSIIHLEMWNILAACRIWGHLWSGSSVHILCDNEAVVHVLNSGASRDGSLAAMARNIWLAMAFQDFQIHVSHIAGTKSVIADLLSRWNKDPCNQQKLDKLVPQHKWWNVPPYMLYIDCTI